MTSENEATGVKGTGNSNHEGVYRFTNLAIGSYAITASAPGFAAATLKNVQVNLNSVGTANLTLSVGTAATTVEVSAAGAVIDTTTAQLQTTFETREAMDLPSASRGAAFAISPYSAQVSCRPAEWAKEQVLRSQVNVLTTTSSRWME